MRRTVAVVRGTTIASKSTVKTSTPFEEGLSSTMKFETQRNWMGRMVLEHILIGLFELVRIGDFDTIFGCEALLIGL